MRCSQCSRLNPDASAYCYFDGRSLGSAAKPAPVGRFAAPFVFPSGQACGTFDALTIACLADWPAALRALRDGALGEFLARIGRRDLADHARRAATLPDADAGLDEVLRGWPTDVIDPAQLQVGQSRLDLGKLTVGQSGEWRVRVKNEGMGLLHGTISSDVPWLAVAEGPGGSSRHFGCVDSVTIPLRLIGDALRASAQPMVGRLTVATNGGEAVIEVVALVPPVPFREGPLVGATTPRQIAEKAKANPQGAAPLFSSGAVARWYASNGWTYPVEGEAADGLASVQQFFEALGLSAPPRLTLSEPSLSLAGTAGTSIASTLRLTTTDKRPVYARATSDQPWLSVQRVHLDGSSAQIELVVASVPQQSGQTLQAKVTIHGNARQQFVVPVRLQIDSVPAGAVGNLDWLPTAPTQTAPAITAARPPVWAPLPREATSAPDRTELTPIATIPAPPANSPGRFWMLAVPICLVGILAVVGTLVAVASSRSAKATIAEGGPATDRPEKEETPVVEKIEEPPPPVRRPKPIIDIRARDRDDNGKPPILVPELEAREVEVVFCLDTTGSMGGLLSGAKKKIWAICNQIAGGRPTPALRVGLVAYRDKGDEYVTKVTDLSRDLDSIHTELETLSAAGGGDIPESVNQALDDAVNKVSWNKDKRTLKIIFLVGDAPPHMDYTDDVKYPVTCKKALEQGIFINSIQCGNDAECQRFWKDIAGKSEGEYVTIPLTGGVVSVPTRHDDALIALGGKLFASALIYGDAKQKRRGEATITAAKRLTGPTGADRVAFAAKSKRISPFDLIDAMRASKVKLEDVPEAELPASLKGLTAVERRDFVEKVIRSRAGLYADALEQEKRRDEALAVDLAKRGGGKDSFDSKVLEILRKQAKKFDISY